MLERAERQPARVALDGAVEDRVVAAGRRVRACRRAFTFGWNGTNESVCPKREQPGGWTPLNITRLCVG